MHELSLPEPMLSLSMLMLATCPEQPPAGGGGRLLLALFGAPRCYGQNFWRLWTNADSFLIFRDAAPSLQVHDQQAESA